MGYKTDPHIKLYSSARIEPRLSAPKSVPCRCTARYTAPPQSLLRHCKLEVLGSDAYTLWSTFRRFGGEQHLKQARQLQEDCLSSPLSNPEDGGINFLEHVDRVHISSETIADNRNAILLTGTCLTECACVHLCIGLEHIETSSCEVQT